MGIVYDFKNAHGMGKGVMPIHRGSNGAISEKRRKNVLYLQERKDLSERCEEAF